MRLNDLEDDVPSAYAKKYFLDSEMSLHLDIVRKQCTLLEFSYPMYNLHVLLAKYGLIQHLKMLTTMTIIPYVCTYAESRIEHRCESC